MIETCYVCLESIDIEKLAPYVCHKVNADGIRYRHLWHGVPGHRPYYASRNEAKIVAGRFLDNPYSSPELRKASQLILDSLENDPEPKIQNLLNAVNSTIYCYLD